MATGTQEDNDEMMSEINMTPLVDVMLVLLVVFIITVPVMHQSLNIDLPRISSDAQNIKPITIRLSIDAQGKYFIDEVPATEGELSARLKAAALKNPESDVHIRADKSVAYERVAQAMAASQQAGLKKIGFVTEPKK